MNVLAGHEGNEENEFIDNNRTSVIKYVSCFLRTMFLCSRFPDFYAMIFPQKFAFVKVGYDCCLKMNFKIRLQNEF